MDALLRISQGLASRCRNLLYRMGGVRMDGYCWLRRVGIPSGWKHIHLGSGVALDHGVQLVVGDGAKDTVLEVGSGCYVNRFTTLEAHRSLTIEEGVMIGPYSYLTDAEHQTDPNQDVRDQALVYRPTKIESGAWIGAHVTIVAGVTVGSGAVIGAGSVVTNDIPAGAVAFGAPARVHRQR